MGGELVSCSGVWNKTCGFMRGQHTSRGLCCHWAPSPNDTLSLAEFSGVLHQCHILASEMVHFIHQMQYYITFEVSCFLPQAVWLSDAMGATLRRIGLPKVSSRPFRFLSAPGMNFGTECNRPRTWTTSSQRMRHSWTPSPPAVSWTVTPG